MVKGGCFFRNIVHTVWEKAIVITPTVMERLTVTWYLLMTASAKSCTGCFRKSTPPQKKTFSNIFTAIKCFGWNVTQFISTHIYQFLKIYLNISSNGVNFSTSTHRFHPIKFWVGLFTHKMKMQLRKWSHFCSVYSHLFSCATLYNVSKKTGPLRLIWHNFTNSQHLLIIFDRDRPHLIINWLR